LANLQEVEDRMSVQISPTLEANQPLANRVRRANRVVESLLRESSQTASALWDLTHDERDRDLLNLAISDPWGSASASFAPEELDNDQTIHRRVHDLIGEMVNPTRRGTEKERIEIRDAFVSTEQLEQFRLRLGQLPDLPGSGLQLHNQVRFVPNRPDMFLLTDFAVEVDRNRSDEVRRVIQDSGFRLREDAPLLGQPDVREAVKRLVEQHRNEGQAAPLFAVCVRIHERENIHLVEVADDVEEMEDGSLEGVGFNAGRSVPGARTLVIYLTHPNDLRLAFERQADHIFFRNLRSHQCDFIYPDDNGRAFEAAFPDLLR
jgi:hypothetical protein